MRGIIPTILIILALTVCISMLITAKCQEFIVPITVVEQSGNNLYNYTIEITLDSTNFKGWEYISINGSDVYFTDLNGNPLYYYIEYFNKTEQKATILVKIPYIPANGQTTIYMHFGGTNPYASYNNIRNVYLFYDDFSTITGAYTTLPVPYVAGATPSLTIAGGIATLKISTAGSGLAIVKVVTISNNFIIEAKVRDPDYKLNSQVGIGIHGPSEEIIFRIIDDDYADIYIDNLVRFNSAGPTGLWSRTIVTDTNWHILAFAYTNGKVHLYKDGVLVACLSLTLADPYYYPAMFIAYGAGTVVQFDYIIVRGYVIPEPIVNVGGIFSPANITLPIKSLYVVHNITYSPTAKDFTYTFMATNTTTAGYEVGVPDDWGWRVYAYPNGTNPNTAILISEINITLPYDNVTVFNVTLLARTNNTGILRQLWIRVLDSNGNVLAEDTNATLTTSWTEITIPLNVTLSGQITIWINATVESSSATPEEIDVRDVRVYIEYTGNLKVIVAGINKANADYFNCSALFPLSLGTLTYLNDSKVIIKIIQYLSLDNIDYPVAPVYAGNETIDGYEYMLYEIYPANYSQAMIIYMLLPNYLKTFKVYVNGYETDTVLVGEPVTIELPVLGNITIPQINRLFMNTTSVTITFEKPGTYAIFANITIPEQWKLGFASKTINVKYGSIGVALYDVDSKSIDYVDLKLQLIKDNNVVVEVSGNKLFNITKLSAGTYTVKLLYKGVVVGATTTVLNITTDGMILNMTLGIKELPKDYRGFNRTIAFDYTKQLVDVKNLSDSFPYSRMTILLNGTGTFTMCIDYHGDKPTRVDVVGNVTGLEYWWDGDCLMIRGTLGSVGEINITDLYRFRIELYDRLGRKMPDWMYIMINNTRYSGGIIEDYFYPANYTIVLPHDINGFTFYGFTDGYNMTSRIVTINNTDIIFKVWYKIPTHVEKTEGLRISRFWWLPPLPFLSQEEERVPVYIQGYIKDYYGEGVPDRTVMIKVANLDTGYTSLMNVTTDATGYFKTPILYLYKGQKYKVDIEFVGDDTFVGTTSTLSIETPEELPPAQPLPVNHELEIAVVALLMMAAVGTLAALKAVSHTIEHVRSNRRRFVKRK